MLRLAQAASSENFDAWGTPPNQRRTGATEHDPAGNLDGELNIVQFYGGWEMVFRPIDEKKAEKIAWLAEGAVENGSRIGYGQGSLASDGGIYHREGVFDYLYGMAIPDTRKIRYLCNCDCSSLAGACAFHAGIYEPALRTMWTGTEEQILMGTGEFIKLTDPLLLEIGTGLKRGDILLKKGHTAIAIDTDDHADTFPIQIVRCSYTRIRSGAGTEYSTVRVVGNGTILHASGRAYDEDGLEWYRVEGGYTSATYAVPLPEASCTSDTWLREDAGTKGDPIIVIPKGATVYLTENAKTALSGIIPRKWYECVYGGHLGWASSLNIKT